MPLIDIILHTKYINNNVCIFRTHFPYHYLPVNFNLSGFPTLIIRHNFNRFQLNFIVISYHFILRRDFFGCLLLKENFINTQFHILFYVIYLVLTSIYLGENLHGNYFCKRVTLKETVNFFRPIRKHTEWLSCDFHEFCTVLIIILLQMQHLIAMFKLLMTMTIMIAQIPFVTTFRRFICVRRKFFWGNCVHCVRERIRKHQRSKCIKFMQRIY